MENASINETTVKKFLIKGVLKIYAKICWKPNESDIFNIQIFVGDASWSGRFSKEFGKRFSQYTDEEEEHYYKNVEISLRGQSNLYIYDFVKTTENDAEFSWKRCYDDSSVFLIHGSVPVHRDANPEPRDSLLDHLLEENLRLRQNLEELNKKYDSVTEEFNECKNELEKFVDIKNSLDQTLYGRFVSLLNTKKRRIQLLEDKLCSSNYSENEVD